MRRQRGHSRKSLFGERLPYVGGSLKGKVVAG